MSKGNKSERRRRGSRGKQRKTSITGVPGTRNTKVRDGNQIGIELRAVIVEETRPFLIHHCVPYSTKPGATALAYILLEDTRCHPSHHGLIDVVVAVEIRQPLNRWIARQHPHDTPSSPEMPGSSFLPRRRGHFAQNLHGDPSGRLLSSSHLLAGSVGGFVKNRIQDVRRA